MSTRFDAASDRISYAGTMFAVGSGFTITAWAYVSVDTNDFATIGRLHASSGTTTIVTWATSSDGLGGPNYFTGGGTVTNATGMAVGAWRKVAISCAGTTGKIYIATVGGATEVDSGTVGVGTADGITLGGRAPGDSGEAFNGRLAYVRVWTAELTQTDIEAEWASTIPVRTAGLWADWPLTDSTDLTDHSGNGRNLSAGTTAVSTEDDPPLATNVTGTGLAAFGGLSATAAGVRTVSGSAASSFGGLTGTAAGARTVLAAAAAALGGLTGAASGTRTVRGTAAVSLGGLTATAHDGAPDAPEPEAALAQGSWYGLLDILREGAQQYREERDRTPEACGDCGEPLRTGPRGELFCLFDGSIWGAGGQRLGQVDPSMTGRTAVTMRPSYATREEIKAELDVRETARSNARIDRVLDDASRAVEGLCHRPHFYPVTGTRFFDWPNSQRAASWRLWLDDSELISVTTLSSGGTVIASTDYLLEPNRSGPPYNRLEIDLASAAAFGGGDTHQRDISITGLWGYRNDETSVGATAEALDASETALDVDAATSAAVGVGSLLRIDSERVIVTGRTNLDTGQTLGVGGLTNQNSAVAVPVGSGAAFTAGETILIDSERMRIDDIAGNALVVTRAWDGSTIAAHTAGAAVYAPRTLTVERGALGTTASTHSTAASVLRWDPPGPVRQLCIAEALTSLLQGRSGYARTAGTGEYERETTARAGLKDLRERVYVSHGRKARVRSV
ncbi:LamG-like jellyroll fold domain-containing protein [Streptomyces sp. PmtG]